MRSKSKTKNERLAAAPLVALKARRRSSFWKALSFLVSASKAHYAALQQAAGGAHAAPVGGEGASLFLLGTAL